MDAIITAIGAILTTVISITLKYYLDKPKKKKGDTQIPSHQTTKVTIYIKFTIKVLIISSILIYSGNFVYKNFISTQIQITFPIEGSYVEKSEVVKGTSKNISSDNKIWIVIFSYPVGRFYPQNNPANIAHNSDWSSLCFLGVQRDTGKKFDIIAILANEEVQKEFSRYLDEARDKNDWPGLEQLPKQAEIYDQITVVRK